VKRLHVWLIAIFMAAGLGLVAPGPASATTSYCGLVWGSLAESRDGFTEAQVVNVRTGRHTCFDRMVIDLNGKVAGYHVRYVDNVTQPGSGHTVPVRGGARLQVTVNAPSYDANGNSTYNPANPNELSNVTGYQTFRQLVSAGSYEGYSDFGLGVRARLPFRVFTLDGPGGASRLVVDVAHFW
jgi:hypothetical protein